MRKNIILYEKAKGLNGSANKTTAFIAFTTFYELQLSHVSQTFSATMVMRSHQIYKQWWFKRPRNIKSFLLFVGLDVSG